MSQHYATKIASIPLPPPPPPPPPAYAFQSAPDDRRAGAHSPSLASVDDFDAEITYVDPDAALNTIRETAAAAAAQDGEDTPGAGRTALKRTASGAVSDSGGSEPDAAPAAPARAGEDAAGASAFKPLETSLEDELAEAGDEAARALREKQRAMIDALDLSK